MHHPPYARFWRAGCAIAILLIAAVPGVSAQTLPAVAESSLGARLQLGGQIVYRIPAREQLQAWANPNGLQPTASVTDAAGQQQSLGTVSATGGRLTVAIEPPPETVLLPVSEYMSELVVLFSGSFFGPVPVRPTTDNPEARVVQIGELSVRTSSGEAIGVIHRRAESRTSNFTAYWIYSDRDVTITATSQAPGVEGDINLQLKRGWNRAIYGLIFVRGQNGRISLRSAAEPPGLQWIYWQWRE